MPRKSILSPKLREDIILGGVGDIVGVSDTVVDMFTSWSYSNTH